MELEAELCAIFLWNLLSTGWNRARLDRSRDRVVPISWYPVPISWYPALLVLVLATPASGPEPNPLPGPVLLAVPKALVRAEYSCASTDPETQVLLTRQCRYARNAFGYSDRFEVAGWFVRLEKQKGA